MNKKQLGKTPFILSKLGLGTVQFGMDYGFTKKKTQEEVKAILESAKKHGINFLDTAREYGDSEEKIGQYLKHHKESFTVATKLKKIPKEADLQSFISRSVEESLQHLNRIDLLQLHQTDKFVLTNAKFWRIIAQLKKEKLIQGFGVSIYDEEEMGTVLHHHQDLVDFFQVPFNLFDQRFTNMKEELQKKSIGLISRSTFLKGLIPCPIAQLPTSLKQLAVYKQKLNQKAKALNMKPEQLALNFVYHHKLIDSTIIGVDSVDELEANIQTLKLHVPQESFEGLAVTDQDLIDPRLWVDF